MDGLLLESLLGESRAGQQIKVSSRQQIPLHLQVPPSAVGGGLGLIQTSAPSQEIANTLTECAARISRLDSVSTDARVLSTSLATFTTQAEAAVRRVKHLDTARQRLQAALERVEDLIDLQASLKGVKEALDVDDLTAAAMHLQRFRSLRRNLEVPESDIEYMSEAEALLMKTILNNFDRTLEEHERQQQQGSSSSSAIGNVISDCCRLLSMLGHGDMGLTRYTSYLKQVLEADYKRDLVELASSGVDAPAVAVNAISAFFARAVNTFSNTLDMASSTFGEKIGPAALLGTVHAVCDTHTPRVLRSVARSARLQAALNAREAMVLAASGMQPPKAIEPGSSSEPNSTSNTVSAAEAALYLQKADDPKEDAPFASAAATTSGKKASSALSNANSSPIFRGINYSDPSRYDSLLDELAMILQRCASYARILASKGFAYEGAQEAYKASRGIREAAGEVSSVYSVLEQGRVLSAVSKAIQMDELLEDGVAAASVDIISARALAALEASSSSSTTSSDGISPKSDKSAAEAEAEEEALLGGSSSVGPPNCGAGAMVSSFVEDSFYVCSLASKRAFATGSADAASAVVNHLCHALTDTLASELANRLRVALDDPSSAMGSSGAGSGGVGPGSPAALLGGDLASASALFSSAIPPAQLERLAALRASIMTSSPVKMAASKLAELQSIPPSSRDAYLQQLAGGASSKKGGYGSPLPGKSGGGSMGSPGPSASTAVAVRLTAEVAATALALNNLQLASACALRLKGELIGQTNEIFSANSIITSKESEKVRTCIAGLSELHLTLKKSLEAGVSAVLTRLTPRLRTALNVFEGQSSLIQYDMSEDAFSASEDAGSNAFETEFLPVLSSILAPYQYSLTPPLAVHIVLRVAAYIARQLEPRIRRKRFNLLGALRFDADVRSLVSFFVDRSGQRRARQRFARLLQMAQLLTSESVAEAVTMMKDSGYGSTAAGGVKVGPSGATSSGGWDLSAEEVRTVLGLRTDFNPTEIAALVK
jgi:COG4 transport protein